MADKKPWFKNLVPDVSLVRPPTKPPQNGEGPKPTRAPAPKPHIMPHTGKGNQRGRQMNAGSLCDKITLYTGIDEAREIKRWCLKHNVPVSVLRDVILGYIRSHP